MTSLTKRIDDPESGAAALWFAADGWVPNNRRLPLLFYRSGVKAGGRDPASAFEDAFRRNGWSPEWRNGVYGFHHYHSTAHEILGFAAGTARLLLGGPNGFEVTVSPAIARCCRPARDIAGWRRARIFWWWAAIRPISRGTCGARPSAKRRKREMAKVPFPNSDPVLGAAGPLLKFWPVTSKAGPGLYTQFDRRLIGPAMPAGLGTAVCH